MKKVNQKRIIKIVTIVALLFSQTVDTNAQGFLKKMAKKLDDAKTETSNGKGGGSSKESDNIIADEPGTIFGNYYWVFLPSKGASTIFLNELKSELPKLGNTLQIKRFESGSDKNIVISSGGINKGAYTYSEDRCAGCEAVNKVGFTSYKGIEGLVMGENPNNIPSAARVFKEDLKSLKEGVLSLGFLGSKYMGYGKADFYIVLSKDKNKLVDITYESMAQLGEIATKKYDEAIIATDKGVAMMKAGNANKAPIFSKARAAAPKATKDYLTGKGITHLEPIYAYEYPNNPAFDIIKNNIQEEIGRQVQFYVVCKNNKVGNENNSQKNIYKTKYVIFQVNVRENGSNNVFDGKYYVHFSGIGNPIADTENVMMYK